MGHDHTLYRGLRITSWLVAGFLTVTMIGYTLIVPPLLAGFGFHAVV